jgi:hypothetical protein
MAKKKICLLCEKRPVIDPKDKKEMKGRLCQECLTEILYLDAMYKADDVVYDTTLNFNKRISAWVEDSSSIGAPNI